MPPTQDDLYRNRDRAEAFGAVARRYDRSRPAYPDALIVDLLTRGSRDVLDVGCGTGKLARLIAARGVPVLGVEIDAGMAEVARDSGLEVEVAAFETWDDAGRRFDLITCGQAWHWIDPATGPVRAAAVLRPGGSIALLWNMHDTDDAVRVALDEVYAEHAPELGVGVRERSERHRRRDAYLAPLEAAGFRDFDVRDHAWQRVYSRDEWLELISTYSDHLLLPDDERTRLSGAVGEVIDSFGGSIVAHYETRAVTARTAP